LTPPHFQFRGAALGDDPVLGMEGKNRESIAEYIAEKMLNF